jgi:hypothetical protein
VQLQPSMAGKVLGRGRGTATAASSALGRKGGPHSGYWRLLVRCHMQASIEAFPGRALGKPRTSGAAASCGKRWHQNGNGKVDVRSEMDLMPLDSKASPGELVLLAPDAKVQPKMIRIAWDRPWSKHWLS